MSSTTAAASTYPSELPIPQAWAAGFARARAGLIGDDAGATRQLSGIFLDVNEEKQLEETLRTRETHLRSILHTISDAMIVIDGRGIIQLFSTAPSACSARPSIRPSLERLHAGAARAMTTTSPATTPPAMVHLVATGISWSDDDPVFIDKRNRPLRYIAVKETFDRLVDKVGIRSASGRRPRLHDLRHTFAVRALQGSPTGRGTWRHSRPTWVTSTSTRPTGSSSPRPTSCAMSPRPAKRLCPKGGHHDVDRSPHGDVPAQHVRLPAGRQPAHEGLLCLELPAAVRVRRRPAQGQTIGADARAAMPGSSAPSSSILRTSAKARP